MLAAQLLDPVSLEWVSAVQETLCVSMVATSPLLGGSHQLVTFWKQLREPEQPLLTSLGSLPLLFTITDGRANCRPPASTQMKASEPINRAILQTTL